jgi:hypothetical protein
LGHAPRILRGAVRASPFCRHRGLSIAELGCDGFLSHLRLRHCASQPRAETTLHTERV